MTLRLSDLLRISQLIILLCFGIVGGRILLLEVRSYAEAKNGVAAFQLLDLTFKAATRISRERGPTNGAIGSDVPLPSALSDALASARSASDNDIDAISQRAAASNIPHLTEILGSIDETRRRLSSARGAMDELLVEKPATRSSNDIHARTAQLIAVIPSLSPVLNAMETTIAQADPRLTGLITAARATTELRDLSGQIGSVFTASLLEQRLLSWDENARLERLKGRAAALGEQLRLSYSKIHREPGIDRALAKADELFFGEGVALLEETTNIGRTTGAYGMAPVDFARLLVPKIESLVWLRDAMSGSIEQHLGSVLAAKRVALILDGCLVALALAVVIGLSCILQLRVCRPLRVLTNAINRLAQDDYSVEIPASSAQDELGDICRATQSLRDRAFRTATLEREAELGRVARSRRKAEVDELARDYSQSSTLALSGLMNFAEQLLASASAMAKAAELTRRDMDVTAYDAEQTSQSLVVAEAASAELIGSVVGISSKVDEVARTVEAAVNDVQATYAAVKTQNEAASRIRSIVSLIERTATQSNLLALNATIESARAGESGKGFAVVAHEVKSLANETAQAARHIGCQIANIEQNAIDTEAAVRNAVATVMRVSAVADAIHQAIDEQGRAINQIGSQVHVIAAATRRTALAMEDVTRTAEQSGLISHSVEKAAHQVTSGTDELRLKLGQFLQALQSASPQ